MSIDCKQLREWVVRPVLEHLAPEIPYSLDAEELLLGTCAQESHMGTWIDQTTPGPGPAYGIFQMEKATHNDLLKNFLKYKPALGASLLRYVTYTEAEEMVGNLYYAAAMCRIHYFRSPGKIPHTLSEQAAYWKKYYNTVLGKGTVREYQENYLKYVR
jgi:hypothetical protein